jgi:RNA-directed DNA polymerase
MLHAWHKFGLENAENEYWMKYFIKHRNPRKISLLPSYTKIVKGKIDFLGMVRGKENGIFLKFANEYNRLKGSSDTLYYSVAFEKIFNGLWVLECEESHRQGTAFSLEQMGIVTCNHVLGSATHAFRWTNIHKKYPVKVIASNKDIDLAIIQIDGAEENGMKHTLKSDMSARQAQLDDVHIIGFPNYRYGDTPNITVGKIASFRTVSAIRRIIVSSPIIAGTSGSPAVNNHDKVIGVAVTGYGVDDAPTENNGIIPISALRYLIEG